MSEQLLVRLTKQNRSREMYSPIRLNTRNNKTQALSTQVWPENPADWEVVWMTKFTYNISPVSVECLDILVNIKQGQFITSVSTNLLMLTPTCISTHHPNTKASISYSQFLCLRRLCSDEEDFLLQWSRMCEFFTGELDNLNWEATIHTIIKRTCKYSSKQKSIHTHTQTTTMTKLNTNQYCLYFVQENLLF